MTPAYKIDGLPELVGEQCEWAARVRRRQCKDIVYYLAQISEDRAKPLRKVFNNLRENNSAKWWLEHRCLTGVQLLTKCIPLPPITGAGITLPAPPISLTRGGPSPFVCDEMEPAAANVVSTGRVTPAPPLPTANSPGGGAASPESHASESRPPVVGTGAAHPALYPRPDQIDRPEDM